MYCRYLQLARAYMLKVVHTTSLVGNGVHVHVVFYSNSFTHRGILSPIYRTAILVLMVFLLKTLEMI